MYEQTFEETSSSLWSELERSPSPTECPLSLLSIDRNASVIDDENHRYADGRR